MKDLYQNTGGADGVYINTINAMFAGMFVYIGIREETLIALTILLFIDFLTGVGASYRNKEPITSRTLRVGVIAKLSTLLLVVSVAIASKAIGIEYDYLLYGGIGMLALGELYSIFANVHCINTGERLKEFTVTALLAERIRAIVERMLK